MLFVSIRLHTLGKAAGSSGLNDTELDCCLEDSGSKLKHKNSTSIDHLWEANTIKPSNHKSILKLQDYVLVVFKSNMLIV